MGSQLIEKALKNISHGSNFMHGKVFLSSSMGECFFLHEQNNEFHFSAIKGFKGANDAGGTMGASPRGGFAPPPGVLRGGGGSQ